MKKYQSCKPSVPEAIFYTKKLFGTKEIIFIVPTNSLHRAIIEFDSGFDIKEYASLYVQFNGDQWKIR